MNSDNNKYPSSYGQQDEKLINSLVMQIEELQEEQVTSKLLSILGTYDIETITVVIQQLSDTKTKFRVALFMLEHKDAPASAAEVFCDLFKG